MALNESNDIKVLRKFDIDLEFGQQWEQYLDDLLHGGKTVEVKTERDQWAQTGNICIEHECYGKPSGINATTADVWIQNLVKDGELICSLMFPTDKLKQILNDIPDRWVFGGDNRASKLQLVSLTRLIKEFRDHGIS